MSTFCMRPQIVTRQLKANGKWIAQCDNCTQVSPASDHRPKIDQWSDAHRRGRAS